MELENITLKYGKEFMFWEIRSVYKAIEKLPLKIGANVKTSMKVFYHGDSIGICPKESDAKITCNNLNELPKNYKSKTFVEKGGENTSQIWIDEFDINKPNVCVEKYSIFLSPPHEENTPSSNLFV